MEPTGRALDSFGESWLRGTGWMGRVRGGFGRMQEVSSVGKCSRNGDEADEEMLRRF